MFIFSLILVGFCFFFLENSFGLISYAISFFFFFFYFNEVSIYSQFFLKYNMLLFVLFNKNMIVNLYKFYSQPNKKVFYLSTFSPSQSTQMR